jgi:hypothetical protein
MWRSGNGQPDRPAALAAVALHLARCATLPRHPRRAKLGGDRRAPSAFHRLIPGDRRATATLPASPSAILPLGARLHAEQPFDLVDAQFFFPDGPAAALDRAGTGPAASRSRRADRTSITGARNRARSADAGCRATGGRAAGRVRKGCGATWPRWACPTSASPCTTPGWTATVFHPLDRADGARRRLAQSTGDTPAMAPCWSPPAR